MPARLVGTFLAIVLAVGSFVGCVHRAPRPSRSPGAHSAEPADSGPAEDEPPRLLPDEAIDVDLVLARIARGRERAAGVAERDLGPSEARQLEIASRFLDEAAEALDVGDLTRADVLSEKALVLIEDLADDD